MNMKSDHSYLLCSLSFKMAADVEMEPWDNWEGGDQSSKQQTQSRNYQQYRQQQQQQQEEEPEPDYFQSMAPVYKKQTKVSNQLSQLCTARTVWFSVVIRPARFAHSGNCITQMVIYSANLV